MDVSAAPLTSFATQMLGLSVAAERVTETIKQWSNSRSGGPPTTTPAAAAHSANMQVLALFASIVVVTLTHADPLGIVDHWAGGSSWYSAHHIPRALSIFVTGLLVSGGSGVWNHILDILKATKVDAEQDADQKLALVGGHPPIPS